MSKSEDGNKGFGIMLTIIVHAVIVLLLCVGVITVQEDLKYDELEIIVEDEMLEQPKPPRVHVARLAQNKPVESVKEIKNTPPKAVNTEEVNNELPTEEATLGDNGDIEKPEPVDTISKRALFKSRDKGDTLAEQAGKKAEFKMKAGSTTANRDSNNPSSQGNWNLEGRSIIGDLPKPEYPGKNQGTVIVRIVVNPKGVVTSAEIISKGTTVTDNSLKEAAKKAALKARFSSTDKSIMPQEGTIRYVFKQTK